MIWLFPLFKLAIELHYIDMLINITEEKRTKIDE
jgi:hypothetical protein